MVLGLSPTPQHHPARRSPSSVEPPIHRCLGCPPVRCGLRLDGRQRTEDATGANSATAARSTGALTARRGRLLTPPPRRPRPRGSRGRGKGSAGRPLGGAPACMTRTIWRCPPQTQNRVVPRAALSGRRVRATGVADKLGALCDEVVCSTCVDRKAAADADTLLLRTASTKSPPRSELAFASMGNGDSAASNAGLPAFVESQASPSHRSGSPEGSVFNLFRQVGERRRPSWISAKRFEQAMLVVARHLVPRDRVPRDQQLVAVSELPYVASAPVAHRFARAEACVLSEAPAQRTRLADIDDLSSRDPVIKVTPAQGELAATSG
jgi:hypothetical protein